MITDRVAPAATPRTTTRAQSWIPAFALLALLWGCSFAFIHIGLDALTPVQVAFWRLALGAASLLIIVVATRTRLPRSPRTWAHLLVLATLLNAVPFTLFAIGQQSVSSVLAGIINATTPLATLVVILAAFREERPTRQRAAGLLIGFLGVAVVLGVWRGFAGSELAGVLACLGAVACYGVAFPYSRRYLTGTGDGPLALASAQVLLAACLMAPVLLITGATPTAPVTADVVAAMLALGALCSGVAYVLNFRIVAVAGASTASSVTYVTPVVAAVVGVTVLGEHVQWNQPLGAVVVLTGIAVSQGLHRTVTSRRRAARI
ncbi:Permease of the drug/metabolite transporter (DMT) superfamily [Quadrisphaera granulorum]|uniref:Drug/metabolite transporter (DMT)-like permease n=1 Tax=Quadrisphaera granulorum TaxID=317664 RepID=A0A316AXK4_9ACTN|nr:DMT family transporter [Quadrisphaera granulorum]PWJ54937.1 drug/metabolite transporter (DMT)-like permease [Quadrisphaera granulorum]SZE95883.1 Permease of the drug/metabolite transporter (DMT) superfamily [Quadrisphaera granulorum]